MISLYIPGLYSSSVVIFSYFHLFQISPLTISPKRTYNVSKLTFKPRSSVFSAPTLLSPPHPAKAPPPPSPRGLSVGWEGPGVRVDNRGMLPVVVMDPMVPLGVEKAVGGATLVIADMDTEQLVRILLLLS